jgi:hypothetical protein
MRLADCMMGRSLIDAFDMPIGPEQRGHLTQNTLIQTMVAHANRMNIYG